MSPQSRSSWSATMDRCRADVRRRGFATVSAFDKDLGAIYTYTVGLSEREHPELVVVGVQHRLAAAVLAAAVPFATTGDRGIMEGDRLPGIIAGASLCAVSVVDTRRLLPAACELYADGDIPVDAYQLAYPDPQGRMPWDPGADGRQRLFGFEPIAQAPPRPDPHIHRT